MHATDIIYALAWPQYCKFALWRKIKQNEARYIWLTQRPSLVHIYNDVIDVNKTHTYTRTHIFGVAQWCHFGATESTMTPHLPLFGLYDLYILYVRFDGDAKLKLHTPSHKNKFRNTNWNVQKTLFLKQIPNYVYNKWLLCLREKR